MGGEEGAVVANQCADPELDDDSESAAQVRLILNLDADGYWEDRRRMTVSCSGAIVSCVNALSTNTLRDSWDLLQLQQNRTLPKLHVRDIYTCFYGTKPLCYDSLSLFCTCRALYLRGCYITCKFVVTEHIGGTEASLLECWRQFARCFG